MNGVLRSGYVVSVVDGVLRLILFRVMLLDGVLLGAAVWFLAWSLVNWVDDVFDIWEDWGTSVYNR